MEHPELRSRVRMASHDAVVEAAVIVLGRLEGFAEDRPW